MPNPKSWFGRGNARALVLSGGILALSITGSALAVGEGEPVNGGERNPNANRTQEYQSETLIIGDIAASDRRLGGYVTRQSNTQRGANAGGAAIYGCRARRGTPQGGEGCLRANNLGGGIAIEAQSNGLPALFQVGQNVASASNLPPFATNATGLVTNLNADKVDGLDAEELANNRFARVNADGTSGGGRGATTARTGTGVYTVTFQDDVSKCASQATQVTSDAVPGTIAVSPVASNPRVVQVRTFDEAEDPFTGTPAAPNAEADGNQPADRAFHLTVTC